MAKYDVFVEQGAGGPVMVHAGDLPGCFAVGSDRSLALAQLEGEIRAYINDLIRHGESTMAPEQVELTVVEEHESSGPFHPDDRAALFGPERRPLDRRELERFLTLATYNRSDLLATVRGLTDSMLDWRPGPEAMTIRKVLYHIGRAELWYISRVSDPEVAPDWRKLPARRFLSLSRASAASQFRALTDDELALLNYPPRDDGDNSEAWTARKALRRLLEHEREHKSHIDQVLQLWRENLLARMTASRASLIWQTVALDEEMLGGARLFSSAQDAPWTAKDLLGHVAAWDELYAERTNLVGQGKTALIEPVELEERNAELAEARRTWTLARAMQALTAARDDYLVALGSVTDADLHRRFKLPWGRRATLATWARWRYRHDDRHIKDIAAWRARAEPKPSVGPKAVLIAALESGRQEMLATAALVPANERETRPVCGVWTLKDVLGHVADWEWFGVEELDGGPSRRSLDIGFRGIQAWNEAHAAARKDQSWETVRSDFQAARSAMGQLLDKMSQDDLAQPFVVPWSRNWTVYRWFHLWLHHEREHAADLRLNLAPAGWPDRLLRFE